jgi:hypothetical protein
MVQNSKGEWILSKKEREDRRIRCIEYLLRYGNIPEARKAANRAGFGANTSVWVTALSKILACKSGGRRGELMPRCNCTLCTEHRRVQDIKAKGGLEDLRVLIDQLEEDRVMLEADKEYYCGILDGSWPQARKIALRIIERCDKRAVSP